MEIKKFTIKETRVEQWETEYTVVELGITGSEESGLIQALAREVYKLKHSDHLAATSSMQATIAELTRERDGLRDASRWIPVSERLPDPHESVLLWVDDDICVGWAHMWKDSAIGWTGIGYDINVFPTHWMPLPEAPL